MGSALRVFLAVACALISCGCAQLELRRALQPPIAMVCADGAPVFIITSERCLRGVCGWTCEPERWK